jgi:GNAT superfamily N-acetyltransferase
MIKASCAGPALPMRPRPRTSGCGPAKLPCRPCRRAARTDEEVRHHFERLVPTTETWLVETGGVAVAVLVLDGAEVDQLDVDPDWQEDGIGSQLVRYGPSNPTSGRNGATSGTGS